MPDDGERWHSDTGWCEWAFCILCVPRNHQVSCKYIQEGYAVVGLCGELYVVMDSVEVVEEVIQFFASIGPEYGSIRMSEPAERFVGGPFECLFFDVFHKEVGSHRG